MKIVDGWYGVDVKCTKDNAAEMVQWLESLGHEIDRCESAFGDEPKTLRQLLEKVRENGGGAGFMFEIFFKDEESALLAKMKYGK